MAPRTAQLDPDELLQVIWSATGNKVTMPRRLLNTGSKAAQQRYLEASGQLGVDLPLAAPVEDVIDAVKAEQQAQAFSAVDQLRAQLDELQARLDGQPLSHAELVTYRQELAQFQRDAIAAQAQLVVIEGRGAQLNVRRQSV